MNGFTIRRGNPTPEEIAVVVAVLQATAITADTGVAQTAQRNWAAPHRQHRPTEHRYGRNAWTLAQRVR